MTAIRKVSVLRVVLLTLAFCVGSGARAEDTLEYNRDIRPILAERCFACHGADSASRKADLRLDQREAAIDGGAIVGGEPDESELIARVMTDDPDMVMPPPETKQKLTGEEQDRLRRWIAQGAEYQPHWAFIPPTKPVPPAVENEAWSKNAIDRFVLVNLEENGLSPAVTADARTLFRRLHLDITGLPPKPADVAKFAEQFTVDQDAAMSSWIDQLMETPAWGEHRGRYWLDAARYGDTHGLHFDNYREMWPYRDWVIRAFNANIPFDQFSIEQLAGDLLPHPTDDQLIATGFQRCNITTNEGGTIDEENLAVYAADRVQTFGWVYLGLTTNCCQCHDHKFDPLTMKDYYSMAAFFRNTTQPAKDGNSKDGRSSVLVVPSAEDKPRWQALPNELAAAEAARDTWKDSARPAFDAWLAGITPQSLSDDIPSNGLVAHLPLTEGEGKDVQNVCVPQGQVSSAKPVTWIPDGKLGPAPVIKDGASFGLGGLGDFEKDQGFSYGAWIKARDKSTSGGIIARMDAPGDNYRGWDLWQNGGSFAVHIIDTWPGNAIKVVTEQAVVNPDAWQHVFVTYDGSGKAAGVRIYVDGVSQKLRSEADSLEPDASIRAKSPLRIGQRTEGQFFEGGAIQDVRVYEILLSDADVQTLAHVVPLRVMLATSKRDRTPEQSTALFEHYLRTEDERFAELTAAVADLKDELEAIRRRSPVTHIQEEKTDSVPMAHILMRGEYDKPTDKVTAAPPAALHPMPDGAPQNRLGLAQWLVDPANSLTPRVTVNRFWQQVFGQGIVATPEDFGVMGMLPSNQALLDWLAVDFVESGWDVKRFFKQVFMSTTYRQSAVTSPEKLEKDRNNMLLSRGPRFRMDAEMVRDYALAASGLLSQKMYGPGVKPYQPGKIWDMVGLPGGDTRQYDQDTGESLYRRTLYTFWKRMAPPPNLEAFNAPSREVCVVRRERTNTPLQALVGLNDPQFVEAARCLAERAIKSSDGAESVMSEVALRLLCRPLRDDETSIMMASYRDLLAYYQSNPADAQAVVSVGDSSPNEEVDFVDLAAWTMVCNQMMNLDEVVNK